MTNLYSVQLASSSELAVSSDEQNSPRAMNVFDISAEHILYPLCFIFSQTSREVELFSCHQAMPP